MNSEIYIAEICRLMVLLILLAAAWGKTSNLNVFRQNLVESFQVPAQWSRQVALLVVGTEWLIAILIMLNGLWSEQAMVAAFLVFVLFTVVVAWSLLKEKSIHCNCFGRSSQRISLRDLLRNIVILIACQYPIFLQANRSFIDWSTQILLLAIAFIGFLIIRHFNEIALVISFKDQEA